jgi:hypothetical protein
VQERAEAGDPEGDQSGVRERADERHRDGVLAPDALAQDEQVLGSDRDDERQAEAETGEQRREHVSTLRGAIDTVQFRFFP